MSAPIARAHTAPEPALQHDAEGLERPARARTAPVPRHTEPETDAIGDTPMGDESEVPGTAGCAESGGKHACLFPCSANPQCSGNTRHRLGPCGKGT